TRLGPAAEAPMHLHTIAEALGQVAPGYAGPVAVEHRLDKQPVARRRDADPALLPRQQMLDPVPLVVTQPRTAHRSAPRKLTAYEAKNPPRRNPTPLRITPFAANRGNLDSPDQPNPHPSASQQTPLGPGELTTRPSPSVAHHPAGKCCAARPFRSVSIEFVTV